MDYVKWISLGVAFIAFVWYIYELNKQIKKKKNGN